MANACNNQDLSLCLRATFIDIDTPAADAHRLGRARSEEPRPRGFLGEDAGAAAEGAYVQQLGRALAALGSPAAARAHFGTAGQLSKKANRNDTSSLATVTTAAPEDSPAALSTDSGSELSLGGWPTALAQRRPRRAVAMAAGGTNTSVAALLLRAKAAEEPAAAPQRPPGSFETASRLSWADEEDLPQVVSAPTAVGCSVGSLGHPELCNRPCIHVVAAGGCESGTSCEYCHMEHPKRAPHLDKRHREMLRSLTTREWASLIMPILEKKVEALDGTGQCAAIIRQICHQARLPEGIQNTAPQRSQRMMVLTLRAMTLKTLVSTVQRNLPNTDETVEELCKDLTTQLRHQLFSR